MSPLILLVLFFYIPMMSQTFRLATTSIPAVGSSNTTTLASPRKARPIESLLILKKVLKEIISLCHLYMLCYIQNMVFLLLYLSTWQLWDSTIFQIFKIYSFKHSETVVGCFPIFIMLNNMMLNMGNSSIVVSKCPTIIAF